MKMVVLKTLLLVILHFMFLTQALRTKQNCGMYLVQEMILMKEEYGPIISMSVWMESPSLGFETTPSLELLVVTVRLQASSTMSFHED